MSQDLDWGSFWSNFHRNLFRFFFPKHTYIWSSWQKKCKTIKKKWKKRQKCINITLRKWSWRPLWQVGKKTYNQVNFLKGLGFFHNFQHVWGLRKNPKIQSYVAKFGCGNGCILVYLIHWNFLNLEKKYISDMITYGNIFLQNLRFTF